MEEKSVKASAEQLTYANILNKGMIVGSLVLIICYAVYLAGVLPTFIPVKDVPKYWKMRVADYVHTVGAPTGWNWLALAGTGYYINYIGIAILGAVSIACYIAVLPGMIRKKDTPMVVIIILEIAVLALAASGILKAGGH
jgi:hypothetical protein